MKKTSCELVTIWDGGTEIRTKAQFIQATGEVIPLESTSVEGVNVLEHEYIEFEDGEALDVCRTCHEYVLNNVMIGKTSLEEVRECTNPECENKA